MVAEITVAVSVCKERSVSRTAEVFSSGGGENRVAVFNRKLYPGGGFKRVAAVPCELTETVVTPKSAARICDEKFRRSFRIRGLRPQLLSDELLKHLRIPIPE